MKTCEYCGKELQDNEVCTCLQPEAPAAPAPGAAEPAQGGVALDEAEPQPVSPGEDQLRAAVEHVKESALVKATLSTLKGLFSKQPTQGLRLAAAAGDFRWVLLLAAELVVGGIGAVCALGALEADKVGSAFFPGLLHQLLLFAMMAVGELLLLKLCRKPVSFNGLLNMVAAACLPLTVGILAGGLLLFVYAPVGLALELTALLLSFILLYLGTQMLAKFKASPLWAFGGVLLAGTMLYSFIVYNVVKAAVESYLDSLMGSWLF